MTDFLNYNALSKDPVAMEEALNKVQVELREERLTRHKLEGEMGRIQRHNKHLEYNLKRMKIQFGQSSPTGNTDVNRKKVAQTTVHVGLDLPNSSNAESLLATPENIRRLLKENEDLRMQADIDRKMKEFLDNQVVSMETQIKQLIARNGDLTVQSEVDKKMKEFLFTQWENSKKSMDELKTQLSNQTRRAEDARAQSRADRAMKEYLTNQWEAEERRVRELIKRNEMNDATNTNKSISD